MAKEDSDYNGGGILVSSHDAVLHKLNAAYEYNDVDFNGFLDMKEAAFADSIDKWKDVPLLYGKWHPDLDKLEAAPTLTTALEGAVNVGSITKAWIDSTGHARLMATFEFGDEYRTELDNLINEGMLSLSTGFKASYGEEDEFGMIPITSVSPNHVLLFIEDQWNIPRDRASGIVSLRGKEGEKMADNSESKIRDLEAVNKTLASEKVTLNAKNAELEAEVSRVSSDTAKLTETIETQKKELDEMRARLAEYDAKALEADWATVASALPAAISKDESALKTEKETFMKDPASYYKGLAMKNVVSITSKKVGSAAGTGTGKESESEGTVVFRNKKYTETEFKEFKRSGYTNKSLGVSI